MPEEITKKCTKCGTIKPLSEYHKNKMGKYGHKSCCMVCELERNRQYRINNPDKIKAHNKKYYHENKERERERFRRYREEHKEREALRYQAYRIENADRIKIRKENYYKSHPEVVKAHSTIGNAIRLGKIKRQPCVVCKATPADGHHEDYSKPWDVIWLCKPHHSRLHTGEIDIEFIRQHAC